MTPSSIVACHAGPGHTCLAPTSWQGLSLIAAFAVLLSGCWNSTTEPKPADAPYMASGGVPAKQDTVASNAALERLAASASLEETSARPESPAPTADADASRPSASIETEGQGQTSALSETEATAESARGPAERRPDPVIGRTQLPPDLSPAQLVQFLGVVDRDMQDLWIRLPQVQGGREELIRIAKMKLEASRRLKNHTEADATSKSTGARGELQALSHLASFSDLNSAQELEELATANLQSNDPDLVADSRLVLIGFALEALQNGEAGAADRVIGYIDQIAASESPKDVPTLMVMGQARDALAGYGHEQHANRIRDTIIELYSDSPNPDLAMAAAELADSIRYDDLERLLSEALNGQSVAVTPWRTAAEELLSQAANLRTVEYLAGAALQLEAIGQDELVQSTFDALTDRFEDADSDAGREVRIAMAARDARHDIIGIRFNPVLPSVDGAPLSMDQFEGRVVIVPFWAAAFPESFRQIGLLKQIQAAHPDDLAIVGVNLDGDDALLQEFVDQNDLGFPSFRSKSSLEAEVANPIAAQFGIASMPFLAILDRQGKVAAVNFIDRGIEEKIEQVLAK